MERKLESRIEGSEAIKRPPRYPFNFTIINPGRKEGRGLSFHFKFSPGQLFVSILSTKALGFLFSSVTLPYSLVDKGNKGSKGNICSFQRE